LKPGKFLRKYPIVIAAAMVDWVVLGVVDMVGGEYDTAALLDHPLKMTLVPVPINTFQIDISGKQTRPKRNSASKLRPYM
jgi:hypothetical protein